MKNYKKEITEYLDEVKGRTTHSIDKVIGDIKGSKYVCVFGAGMTSLAIVSFLKKYSGITIDFLCDNDQSKWGSCFHEGLMCISPAELEKYKDEVGIIIATRYCSEVYEQLRDKGFRSFFYLKEYRLLGSEYFEYGAPTEKIKQNALKLNEMLCDEKSKETLFTIIKTWFDFDINHNGYESIYSDDQYYPDGIIKLQDDEAFVDGGAYTGDSLLNFLDKSKGAFDSIFAFELDECNFKTLTSNVARLDSGLKERIKLYNVGLLDEVKIVGYETGNSRGKNSVISEDSRSVNRAITGRLSDILANEKVTYIKLDVEGAEVRALCGAEEIIRQQMPKLAICVYHKIEHLWEVPFFIKSVMPEYKIFLRHHTALEYETVCYAVK